MPEKIILLPEVNGSTAVSQINEEDFNSLLENAISDENGKKTVVMKVNEAEGCTEYRQKIPASIFAALNSDMKIRMETPLGTIGIQGDMFKAGEINKVSKVEIGLAIGDTSNLNEDLKNKIGNRPVIELSASIDGKKTDWKNSDAPVTVSIDYKPTAEELKDPDHIVVWYIDGNGGVNAVPSGRYNEKTGKVVFTATHFSQYAVVSEYSKFSDVADFKWAEKEIGAMASKGVIGTSDSGRFSPGAYITRAEFISYIVRALGLSAESDSNFSDVKSGDAYYEPIGTAKSLGITQGTGQNKFGPGLEISRQDMMVIVEKALRVANKLAANSVTSNLSEFTDRSAIAGYALESVAVLVGNDIVKGDGKRIDPKGKVTKAQSAVIAYRIYKK